MILPLASILLIGFVFGFRHALDADHVLAVSVMSARDNKKDAVLRGIFWGAGHTTTLLIVGFFVLILGKAIPEKLSASFEIVVGAMLIILGVKALYDFVKRSRMGSVLNSVQHSHFPYGPHMHPAMSFWVGAVHGLAGSATLLLGIIASVKYPPIGLLYILMFGVGLICAMTVFSIVLAISTKKLRLSNVATGAASILSILGGVLMIFTGSIF